MSAPFDPSSWIHTVNRLAFAHLQAGGASKAVALLQLAALARPTPAQHVALAHAQVIAGAHSGALRTLSRLDAQAPGAAPPAGEAGLAHLIAARAHAALGAQTEAAAAFALARAARRRAPPQAPAQPHAALSDTARP